MTQTTGSPLASDKVATQLAWFRQMRQDDPVSFDEKIGAWQVFGHPEANRVLADPATFSSDLSELAPPQEDLQLFLKGNFVRMDPPRHRKFRSLVNQAFTPRVVQGLAPSIAELTGELLDATHGSERIDLIRDLADPLPAIVIAELLGIPVGDRDHFRHWIRVLVSTSTEIAEVTTVPDDAVLQATIPTLREMNEYLFRHIRQRRAHPTEDLISKLTMAEVDGQQLDDEEIIGFVALLLVAGHITTTMLLGNAVLALDEHPEAAARLRADPTLLPTAIEEVLRVQAPFARTERLVTGEADLGGHTVRAGQFVIVWLASANRDERQFTDPDRFDISRDPNPHLTFGHGIHFCVGAPLARLEAKIALGILLERYVGLSVIRDTPIEFYDPRAMNGVKRLPVVLTPA